MKILIEGDGYGLPRFKTDSEELALCYEKTYPERLRKLIIACTKEDVLVINRCRHANTTQSLALEETKEIIFLKPDYTIIQLGLADLWPLELSSSGPLQKAIKGNSPKVTVDEYELNLKKFAESALHFGSKVIIVGIPRVREAIVKAYPLIEERINLYNEAALRVAQVLRNVEFVNLYHIIKQDDTAVMIGDDGIHPTPEASSKLAWSIYRTVMA